jgi:DNA repair photolyase
MEEKYQLTRGALKLIDQHRFGIVPLTKSALIARDIDLYQSIAKHSPATVMMTITTADDKLAGKIEPGVSPPSDRFYALKAFTDAGVRTGIAMMPILPFLEDTREYLEEIVDRAKEAGVSFIAPGIGMTIRDGQREHFYAALDRDFPGIRQKYEARYGLDYSCSPPDYQALKTFIIRRCQQADLHTRMCDIVDSITKGYVRNQLSFVE